MADNEGHSPGLFRPQGHDWQDFEDDFDGSLSLACNDRKAFFTDASDQSRYTMSQSCQKVCDAISYLMDNIYFRFGTKLS